MRRTLFTQRIVSKNPAAEALKFALAFDLLIDADWQLQNLPAKITTQFQ